MNTAARAAFHLGRMIIQQTRIQSGVYKSRKVHIGGINGPLMNEEQLLADELGTMEAHSVQLAQMAYP